MRIKYYYLGIFLFYIPIIISAQDSTIRKIALPITSTKTSMSHNWEGGLFLGATAYTGDILFALPETRWAVGLLARRSLGDNFSLTGSLLQGQLAGSDSYSKAINWRLLRNFSFKSPLTELSVRAEWYVLGKSKKISLLGAGASVMDDSSSSNLKSVRKRLRGVAPFIFAGGGLAFLKPTTNFNDGTSHNPITEGYRIDADRAVNSPKNFLVVPFGVGLRFPMVNSQTVLTVEGGFRPTFSDYIDGISIAGNPQNNDWFFVGGLSLTKVLGSTKDSDGDGIADKYDKCPFLKGGSNTNGCPDRDGDGISDDKDECPTVAGLKNYDGCPDSDGDGIVDKYDKCPFVAGLPQFKGCLTAIDSTPRNVKDTVFTLVDIVEGDSVRKASNNISSQIDPNEMTQVVDYTKKSEKTLENEVNKIQKTIDIAKAQKATETKITDRDNALKTSESKIADKDNALKTSESKVADKDNALKTSESKIVDKDNALKSAESKIADKDNALKSAESKIVDKDNALKITETKIADKDNALKSSESKITEGDKEKKTIDAITSETQKEKMSIDALLAEKERLQKAIDAMSAEKERLQKTIDAMSAEKERLQKVTVVKPIKAEPAPPPTELVTTQAEKAQKLEDLKREYETAKAAENIKVVYFDTKKAIYKPDEIVILNEIAKMMLDNPKYKLYINGHTDKTGSMEQNQTLSVNRAKSCYLFLQKKGVATQRMIFQGFGETQPITDDETAEGKQLNRRVEFEVIKNE